MAKSRWFRVAVSGATSDGRIIADKDLREMAADYNRDTYAARVNLEHIRGITADPPFQSLGDVLALKVEDVTLTIGGSQEKRLGLFAEIEALDPLIKMNAARQKLYTSVEINPNFADKGRAYLMGLAVTDSPASLGTEMLQFAAGLGDKSPLAARKQQPGNLFTEAHETAIVLDAAPAPDAATKSMMESVTAFVQKLTGTLPAKVDPEPKPEDKPADAATAAAGAFAAQFAALGPVLTQLSETLGAVRTDLTALAAKVDTDLSAMRADIETTAQPHSARPPAAPANGNPAMAGVC